MSLSNCLSIRTFKKAKNECFFSSCVQGFIRILFYKIIVGEKATTLIPRKKDVTGICGSFPAVVFSDNGDIVFIHQEVLSVTARDSRGNTSYLKHVSLWDFTIRITVLISSPLEIFFFFSLSYEKE